MTLRERIADWISGGALTRAKHDAREGWAEAYKHMCSAEIADDKKFLMRDALNRIAACETPRASSTVRRMARIAREAME